VKRDIIVCINDTPAAQQNNLIKVIIIIIIIIIIVDGGMAEQSQHHDAETLTDQTVDDEVDVITISRCMTSHATTITHNGDDVAVFLTSSP